MAKLTTKRRDKLPAKDFGFPAKRAYPLENKAHAKSALARGKHDLSKLQYIQLAKRVKRKYPRVKIKALEKKP